MIVDISAPLRPDLTVWPGDPPVATERLHSREQGDESQVTVLRSGVHAGTHIDAPSHFLVEGSGIESIPLESCVGECLVVDLTHLDRPISGSDLSEALESGAKRILCRTSNSGWSSREGFDSSFIAYDVTAAEAVVRAGVVLLGIDALSIEPRGTPNHPTHRRLLEAGVVILEGLELGAVEPGVWNLIALPILIPDSDGAPVRAVLTKEDS